MVFIHGAGGSHLDWSAEWRRLPQANALLLDLPGHGKSSGDGRESIQHYAEDIIKFLDALDLQQVIVAGHSMGGAIVADPCSKLSRPDQSDHLGWHRREIAGTSRHFGAFVLVDQSEVGILLKEWLWSSTASPTKCEASYQQFMKTPAEITYHDYKACNNFDMRAQIGQDQTTSVGDRWD